MSWVVVKVRRWWLWFVLVAALATMGGPAHAAIVDVSIYEASAYQNVVATGDLLVLIRYELPTTDWQVATYMNNATCADAADFVDPCYISLQEGVALQTLYDGPAATASLRSIRQLPRVGQGLSALYLAAGHGLTFSTTTYETCVEGSATAFSPMPQSCITIQWNTSANVAATPAVIQPGLLAVSANLEQAAAQAKNTFLNIDKITQTGMIFMREAFPPMPLIVPDAFFIGTTNVFADVAPTPGATGLESDIQSTAQASTAWSATQDIAREYGGVSVRMLGSVLVLALTLATTVAVGQVTGNFPVGALAGGIVLGGGVLQDFVVLGPVFVTLGVLLIIGSSWLFRRVPAG